MASLEKKIKHLEFIQLTITRMAANSFLLKAWTVTIIAALLALSAKDANRNFAYIGLLPVLMFWYLDSFYLRQEKMYRKLYEAVIKKPESKIDFSLNANIYRNDVYTMLKVMISKTIFPFYGSLILILVIIKFTEG